MKIIMKTTIFAVVCAVLAAGCSRTGESQTADSVTGNAALSESAAPAPAQSEPAPAETAVPETAAEESVVEDASAEDTVAENTAELEAAGGESQTAVSTAAPKYAIGETGPGGGIVFANAGGRYKEITMPGREDTYVGRYQHVLEYVKAYSAYSKIRDEQETAKRQAVEEAKAAGNTEEAAALEAARIDWSNNYPGFTQPLNQSPKAPPAGWREATAPELIAAYDALKKTGKVNFGNVLYYSSSYIDYAGYGKRYTRNAVTYVPGAEDSGPFGPAFPAYRIIRAGGGPGEYHLMDMGNGAVVLVNESYMNIYGGRQPSNRLDYKNFTLADIRVPYVREF